MPHTITRSFEFDAAHRVLHHEGKCKHLHGHRYKALVTVRVHPAAQRELDRLGRVIDFSVMKDQIGWWIDTYWDHNIILHPDDPLLAVGRVMKSTGVWVSEFAQFDIAEGGKMPFIMPGLNPNPTAENMAKYLFTVIHDLDLYHIHGIEPLRVRLYETPNCYADYTDRYGVYTTDRQHSPPASFKELSQ